MSISIGAKGDEVRKLQKALQSRGFDPGAIDGIFGPNTRKALINYQLSIGAEPSGVVSAEMQKKLGLDLGLPAVPKTRAQFKQLMLGNPNYFGTMPDTGFEAVAAQSGNTNYEELICVGYQPQLRRLVAVVEVKLMGGYSGSLCSPGSQEYVRFFVDWNNDGTWVDLGVSQFTVHDIPERERLYYTAAIQLSAKPRSCQSPFLPRVRAILSWNSIPTAGDPDYTPVWGNALESTIQIKARPLWWPQFPEQLPEQLVELLGSKLEDTIQEQSLIFGQDFGAQTMMMPSKELLAAYAKAKVPALRYGAGALEQLAKAKSASKTAALLPSFEQQLGIQNLAALLEQWLEPGDGNQSYEELTCVGYDRDQQSLSAIVKIKQSAGYGGNPCRPGSNEYVSFWLWDESAPSWVFLGQSSVRVHDLPVPKDGVDYEVFLPVDFTPYQKPCEQGPTTLKIRAILSWNSPTSTPDAMPYWGGREEVTVEVKPGPKIGTGMQMPFIDSVGDMAVCNIEQSTGFADGPGVITGGNAEDAPFGGMITITGFFSNPPSSLGAPKPKYRLSVRPFRPGMSETANPWQPLTNEFDVSVLVSTGGPAYSTTLTQTADSEGFYTYPEVLGGSEWQIVTGRVLGKWFTGVPHDVYQLRIEGKDALGTMVATGTIVCEDGTTRQEVKIHLDNIRPNAELRLTQVIPVGETKPIAANDCGKFNVGDRLIGEYVATDDHFGSAGLMLRPDPDSGPSTFSLLNYDGGANPTGTPSGTWEIDTSGMRPCGYSLTLQVIDRTIVGSRVSNHWRSRASIGFCLEQPPE